VAAPAADRAATDRAPTRAPCRSGIPIGTLPVDVSKGESRMSDYEFTMSLRIRHPNVEPAEITRILGIEPQHTWRAGERRRDPAGVELEGTYRESYWMGRLMAEPELASDHVGVESELLRTLAQLRRSFDFLETLKTEGGAAELLVTIFAREDFRLEFIPESLGLLGRLGLTIALDVKPHPKGIDGIASL
jgi:hypothetical protein